MEETEVFSVNFPPHICMYGGAPFTIYHDGLLDGGAGEYFFKWSCPVGRAMKDSLVFDAGIAPGVYPLKLEVFDESMKKVAESLSELAVNDGSGSTAPRWPGLPGCAMSHWCRCRSVLTPRTIMPVPTPFIRRVRARDIPRSRTRFSVRC